MKLFSRKTRRPVSPLLNIPKPRVEQLEDRLTPAGFGPEDGAYIVESWSGSYTDVQIQGDQKIVAAGYLSAGSGLAIARYDSAGIADASYGSGGLSTPAGGRSSTYAHLVLQPDGKAVVSSTHTASGYLGAARLKTNGSLDTTFSSDGWTSVNASPGRFQFSTGVALQSTGKIVVAGSATVLGANPPQSAVLGGFKANGDVNSGKGGFGPVVQGGKATGSTVDTFGAHQAAFTAVAVQPDDKVVAVGNFSLTGAPAAQLIVARYTAAGILDTTFNGNGYSVLNLPISYTSDLASNGVALQADGKIVVVSSCPGIDGPDDMLVVRFTTSGILDTSFGGGTGYVRLDIDGTVSPTYESGKDVVIQPDGKIVVVGYGYAEGTEPGPRNVLVARLNQNGTADSTFGGGGFKVGAPPSGADYHSFRATSVALKSDGSIIVSGRDDWDSDLSVVADHPFLMRFFGTPALEAAGGAARAPSDANSLTHMQVSPLLTEALARWQSAGVDTSVLSGIDVRIADLGGATLGLASGNTIWLDDNAAGWGWFVDPKPHGDSPFTTPGNQGEQYRMDLLTVLSHEIGHLLGHDHEEDGVMQETLSPGQRLTLHGVNLNDYSWLIGSSDLTKKRDSFGGWL